MSESPLAGQVITTDWYDRGDTKVHHVKIRMGEGNLSYLVNKLETQLNH